MNIALLEIIFVAVVVLGFGFWQLYDVNRALRKDRSDGDRHEHGHCEGVSGETQDKCHDDECA